MSSPSSPSGLPFLPGYSFDVQPKTSFHRAQKFAVVNGVRVHDIDHGKNAEIQRAAKAVMEKEWSKELKQLEETKRKVENNVETAWIDQGRGVLRFFAFFKEAVHSSPLENFRVRKCTLCYFLEDKTICITEPRQDNSGLPQGVFTKRHQVPKDDVNFYGIDDLFVGAELHIYGRVFRLVDCDAFTRGFYQQKGKELAPSEEYPVDPFAVHTQQKVRTSFNKTMNPLKAFMEASMGRSMGVNVEVTKQFLANDRKVLRFYCLWDDPSMYGDKRKYVMHYYLADDTVEVLEILPPNSGRDPFPALLKRSKLPQNYSKTVANVATIGSPVVNEFYTDADLHIGSMINVFGRELLLCGCDKYTQQFYMKNYGMKEEDLTTLDVDEPGKEWPKMEVPPYTGFGTEEDSLGSFTHLVPKVPRKDFKKLMQNDGQNLRFLAKFSHPVIEDVERRFILTYFLADDTISIFEKVERNSGFVGGKFLERSRVKRSDTQQYLQPSEFFVGAVLPINNFDFELVEADEYTYQYMEEHQQQFPKSSPSCVANELKRQGLSKETFSALEEAWKSADSNCDNTVDKSEFKNMLMKAGYQLSEHEFQTILRKFDKNGDGRIDYKEFASTLL